MALSSSSSYNKSPKKFLPLIILGIVTALSIGVSVYLFVQVRQLKQNPQAQAAQDADDLVVKVGMLMVLPKDEKPTIATVADPSKLRDQAFFVHAVAGDKVLIYTSAKKAILYSPTENKIVEVAPINLGNGSPSAQASEGQTVVVPEDSGTVTTDTTTP